MKKHITAEQRKQNKEKSSANYREKDVNRQKAEAEARQKAEAEKAEKQKAFEKKASAPAAKPAGKLKSKAKAAGVKSVFVVDDQVVMTSFGKGNAAVLEKVADASRTITTLNVTDPKYDVTYGPKRFSVTGKLLIDRGEGEKEPIRTTIQDDYDTALKDDDAIRSALERRYFGQTFRDNIHIQLIYNILDIEKLLTPHVNNIVYSLGKLGENRASGDETDLVGLGRITTKNLYDDVMNWNSAVDNRDNLQKSFNDFQNYLGDGFSAARKRLAYYGDLFYRPAGKDKWEIKDDKTIYQIIGIVSDLRQQCFHDNLTEETIGLDNKWGRAFLSNLDACLNDEAKEVLHSVFAQKAKELKTEAFLKTAGKSDLAILLKTFGKENAPEEEQLALVQEFYDFKIRKDYKNLGFSIKKLREAILLLPDAAKYGNKEDPYYCSIRHKLYGHLDFIICKYFKTQYAKLSNYQNNDIFSLLRACRSDEEKDAVYANLAKTVWEAIRTQVEAVDREIKCYSTDDKKAYKTQNSLFEKVEAVPMGVSLFSELIFLLTKLLDGKEINTLCTSLINKFENIASFLEVLKQQGLKWQIEENYRFYESAQKIADELRLVNNMARMSVPLNNVKTILVMYRDAAELLGLEARDDGGAEPEKLFKCKPLCDRAGRPLLDKKGNPRYDMSFRNFIINNVISSRRFLYLIRFVDPKGVRSLAVNPSVIRFVLKDIPDDQIKRYYSAVGESRSCSADEMREALAKRLQAVNFLTFQGVDNRSRGEEKQRMQAIVRLYLTVPYLFVKNMVNVNARYVVAFHCLERDFGLDSKSSVGIVKPKLTQKRIDAQKARIAELEAEENRRKESGEKYSFRKIVHLKHQLYMEDNVNNTTESVRKEYRNAAAHLNMVSVMPDYLPKDREISSYFAAYHLCMQLYLYESQYPQNPNKGQPAQVKTKDYFDAVMATKSYCKDFVKALNAPFGYNLPRFKNLSIEALFDKERRSSSKNETVGPENG